MKTRRLKIFRWTGDAIMVYDETLCGVNLEYHTIYSGLTKDIFSGYYLRKHLDLYGQES